LPNLSAP